MRLNNPAAVRQDLMELSQAIVNTVGNLEMITLKASPNGRTVIATKSSYVSDPVQPLGVWIWPDWRDSANCIHVPEFSQARVLSNYHLYLSHDPRKHGAERLTSVIDWRNPQHHFAFKQFKPHLLRIADNGRWACPTSGGALVVGWLNANDPTWAQETIAVPLASEPRGLMLRRDGSQLLAETIEGDNVIHCFTLTESAAVHVDAEAAYFYSDTLLVGDDALVAVMPPVSGGTNRLILVGPEGALSVATLEWDEDGDENPRSASPSGKYVVTKSSVWPPGAIEVRVRKTPKAGANDALPSLPQTHDEIGGGELWLSWNAP